MCIRDRSGYHRYAQTVCIPNDDECMWPRVTSKPARFKNTSPYMPNQVRHTFRMLYATSNPTLIPYLYNPYRFIGIFQTYQGRRENYLDSVGSDKNDVEMVPCTLCKAYRKVLRCV